MMPITARTADLRLWCSATPNSIASSDAWVKPPAESANASLQNKSSAKLISLDRFMAVPIPFCSRFSVLIFAA